MKDLEMINEIRKGNREKSLKFLYKEFPKVKANILSSGGTKETAQEIFNDIDEDIFRSDIIVVLFDEFMSNWLLIRFSIFVYIDLNNWEVTVRVATDTFFSSSSGKNIVINM